MILRENMTTERAMPAPGWREEHLIHLWRTQRLLEGMVSTLAGESYRVVYPGRRNRDEGPDFQGAILANDKGGLINGDIEVHLRAQEWYGHGHHEDQRYSNVILHVVLWDHGQAAADLPGGGIAPTTALSTAIGELPPEAILGPPLPMALEPCSDTSKRMHVSWEVVLDRAGDDRFAARADQLEGDLHMLPAQEVLFMGIMTALGYSRNAQAFLQLAEQLPWEHIAGLVQGKQPQERAVHIQALMLGMARLLPSQRKPCGLAAEVDATAHMLEGLWSAYHLQEPEAAPEWHFFRVRPSNHPMRRIVGASYLLSRALEQGLIAFLLQAMQSGENEGAWRSLEEALMVQVEGYWSRHWDFGKSFRGGALIGVDRAREIAINGVLPFFLAWSHKMSDTPLEERVWRIYRGYPAMGDNQIVREMLRQLSLEDGVRIDTARRQQGLLHLYKSRCLGMRCQGCPFNRSENA